MTPSMSASRDGIVYTPDRETFFASLGQPVGCPNPRCEDGEVHGGTMGYLLCPDCRGGEKAKLRPKTIPVQR